MSVSTIAALKPEATTAPAPDSPQCPAGAPEVLRLVWMRCGDISWSQDWVADNGYRRFPEPGLEHHISFANQDLRTAGLPEITRDESGELQILFDARALSGLPLDAGPELVRAPIVCRLLSIVAKHGFERQHQPHR